MGGIRILAAVLGGALLLGVSEAQAGHICELVEPGLVEVDAMLDEWSDIAPLHRGASNPDASYELRCAYDDKYFYAAVRVRDDRLVRTGRKAAAGEDNLFFALRAASGGPRFSLRLFPGTRGFKRVKLGGGGKVRVEDSLQEDGWSTEIALPLAQIPGWGRSTPLLRGELVYADVDQGGRVHQRRRFFGSLHFAAHVPALRGLLKAIKMSVFDLKLDRLANFDGMPGTERVIAGGRFIGVLSDSFGFIELPVESPSDILKVDLVDFDGSGRVSILAHFRQAGGGGSREVVTIWNLGPQNQCVMSFGFEVAKSFGKRRLANRWSLVPAGTSRAVARKGKGKGKAKGKHPAVRGVDILVEVAASDNQGWDAASFAQVAPAGDVRPILSPWDERRRVVYYFEGTEPFDADAR
jgi:hypothetical protein